MMEPRRNDISSSHTSDLGFYNHAFIIGTKVTEK